MGDDADAVRRHVFQPDHNGECLICDNWADHPLHVDVERELTPEQIAELREMAAMTGATHDCWEWRLEGKCQLCDRELSMCGRCYDQDVATFSAACAEKPETLLGAPLGQYHCPDCGAMVLAGLPHPDLCQRCLDRKHPGFDA